MKEQILLIIVLDSLLYRYVFLHIDLGLSIFINKFS